MTEWAREWAAKQTHRESTARSVRTWIDNHVAPTPLGQRRLVDVRRSDLQGWIKGRAQVLAPSTLRIATSRLSTIFLAAVDDDRIAKSPVTRLDLPTDDQRVNPSRTLKPDRVVPLSVGQVLALADAVPAHCRAMVLTQAGLGLRVGELLALRPCDVDFLGRVVHVTEQVHPRRPDVRVPLKTKRSRRDVLMPSVVVDALAAHLAKYPADQVEPIFRTVTGRPWWREQHVRVLKPAVAAAGLPAWVSSHHLRHHYVSLLLENGESVATVAERIGDTVDMVVSTYAHMMPDDDGKRTGREPLSTPRGAPRAEPSAL